MRRRTGISQLAYTGVQARTPAEWINIERDPLTSDYKDYFVGTFWFRPSTKDLWFLASKDNNLGDWVKLTAGGTVGVQTLTGDIGGAVGPDGADNIDILGTAGQVVTTGTPGTNTLTISLDGSVATSYLTDDGNSAIPAANVLKVAGASGIATSSSGNTLTIDGSGLTVTTTFNADTGSATPAANILNVVGDGVFTATSGTGNTLSIGLISSVGNDGEVIIGATGGAPAWNNITSSDASITVTNGPNTIDLSSSGGAYDSGTFTPVLTFGGGSTGITYDIQLGYYTKIGNRCIVYIEIRLTSKGSSTGVANISGLPFASTVAEVDLYGVPLRGINFTSNYNLMHGNISGVGVTDFDIQQASYRGYAIASITNAEFANNSYIQFDGSYIV